MSMGVETEILQGLLKKSIKKWEEFNERELIKKVEEEMKSKFSSYKLIM